MDYDRRSVIKKLGATGIVAGGFSHAATAKPGNPHETFGIESEPLSRGRAIKEFVDARAFESVKAMRSFVGNEYGVHAMGPDITAQRVSPPEQVPDHVVIETPLRKGFDQEGTMYVSLFDEAASVTAVIDGEGYKSNPEIITELDDDVVPVTEWQEYKLEEVDASNADVTTQSLSVGTDGCQTGDYGDLCIILGSLVVVTSVTLAIIPEPGSTAVGIGLLAKVLAGGCAVSEVFDRYVVDGCDINTVTVCVDWHASVGWSGVTWEADATVHPHFTNC